MKQISKWLAAGFCFASIAGFTSCNDDNVYVDVDGKAPEMNLDATEAWIEGGRDLTVKGTLTDNDGIAKIDIVCHELLVNKTIDLLAINKGEAPTSYELSYKIQTRYHIIEADSYVVDVTVTDVGGRKNSIQIPVRLDGDITPPVFTSSPDSEMAVLIKPGEATSFDLEFSLSDNKVIDYVEISLQERFENEVTEPEEGEEGNVVESEKYSYVDIEGYPKVIPVNQRTFNYSEPVSFPDDQERTLVATISAYDKEANEAAHITERTSVIQLTPLTENFKLWLCDVENVEDMSSDVFGVPMLVDNVGPYKYQARYYNEKAGTQIFFVGQKGNFGPITFGPLKTDKNVLGDAYKDVDRITLDKEGVYYLIKFNTLDRTYDVSTYTVEEAVDPIMHLHYDDEDNPDLDTWWDGGSWWQVFNIGPASGPTNQLSKMERDSKNKHIYIARDWQLTAGSQRFIIHNWHSHEWWNLATWRVDNSNDPDIFYYYGNYFTDTDHYTNNQDWFDYYYGDAEANAYMYPGAPEFNVQRWGNESYRKNYIPDNWVDCTIRESGRYTLILDAHLCRAKLIPQE